MKLYATCILDVYICVQFVPPLLTVLVYSKNIIFLFIRGDKVCIFIQKVVSPPIISLNFRYLCLAIHVS